jgi:hypothetical protein
MSSYRAVRSHGRQAFLHLAQMPPLVYIVAGVACLAVWALGTSVQMLTSEAWMLHMTMHRIDFTAFGQVYDAFTGHLLSDLWVPFMFALGTQFALIVASIGIELPSHPRWRYVLAWFSVVGLVVTNSCGDFSSSAQYGFWGQCGFTIVIFFVTFCVLLFAIMAFKHAALVMRQSSP